MTFGLHRRKKVRRLLVSRWMVLVLLLAVFFVGRAAWNMYEKERLTNDNLAAVEADYGELQKREKNLSEKLKDLNTEKGIEREIRDTYGVVKDNEGVIIIVDDEEETEQDEERKEEKSWWEKLFNRGA